MISLRNVCFSRRLKGALIENVSFDLDLQEHHALLCSDPAQRLALVQLITRQSQPDQGELILPEEISFPLGSNDVFHMPFSTQSNIDLVSRLYGLHKKDLLKFLDAMIGTPYNISIPLSKLPVEQKEAIILALSYGVPFQVYVANMFALPGSDGVEYRNLLAYLEYLGDQGRYLLLITQAPIRALDACSRASVLVDGELVQFDDMAKAIKLFNKTAPNPREKKQLSDNNEQ